MYIGGKIVIFLFYIQQLPVIDQPWFWGSSYDYVSKSKQTWLFMVSLLNNFICLHFI